MQKQQGQSGKRLAKNAGGAVFSERKRRLGIFRRAEEKGFNHQIKFVMDEKRVASLLCACNEMNCVFNAVGVREKSASSASQ
jgi:hypothetical protein